MLTTLPDELLRQVFLWLDARQIATSVATAHSVARHLRPVVEACMEMQGSAWPTLLQGENPTWALHIVSTLRGRGPSWRYLFIGSTLLLHHSPSDTTLHLEPWTKAEA